MSLFRQRNIAERARDLRLHELEKVAIVALFSRLLVLFRISKFFYYSAFKTLVKNPL